MSFGGSFGEVRKPGRRGGAPLVQRVACLGDSITRNIDLDSNIQFGGGPWPTVLGHNLGSGYLVDNFGVGGNTSAQLLSRWRSDIRGRGYSVLVVFGGVNDLNYSSDSAATIYANLTTIYSEALGDGLSVVVVTVLPYGASTLWTSDNEARRTALNGLILGTAGVRRINAEPAFADPAQPTRMLATYDIGDGIHITQAGANKLAQLGATSITGELGTITS